LFHGLHSRCISCHVHYQGHHITNLMQYEGFSNDLCVGIHSIPSIVIGSCVLKEWCIEYDSSCIVSSLAACCKIVKWQRTFLLLKSTISSVVSGSLALHPFLGSCPKIFIFLIKQCLKVLTIVQEKAVNHVRISCSMARFETSRMSGGKYWLMVSRAASKSFPSVNLAETQIGRPPSLTVYDENSAKKTAFLLFLKRNTSIRRFGVRIPGGNEAI
jgi:hypothetical protein